jgi:Fe2+ transport system protein FeoA
MQMLPVGQTAQIRQILGLPDAVHRFEELGLRGGAQVEMVRSGDPCIVRLATRQVCFRADDVRILVQPGALN